MSRLQSLDERVKRYLAEEGLEPQRAPDGPYVLKYGSTVLLVSLFEEAGHGWCRIAALVLHGFEPTLAMLQHLPRLNTQVVQGAFLLFEDDTLAFSCTLLGDDLDEDTFRATVSYVARIGDEYDEPLRAMGGGQTGQDLISPSA